MLNAEDHRVRRCPRLGHDIHFRYCRTQEEERLCPRILDCWWEIFDINGFLKAHLSPEEWEHLTPEHPKPKITGILELIQKARESADNAERQELGPDHPSGPGTPD